MYLRPVLGIIATGIALFSYIPYFRDIFRGRTKPHAFSWLVWGTLTGIAFFGQVSENAGPGAWVMGVTSLICSAIFITALYKGEKHITMSDWVSLVGAAVALVLWFLTKGPVLSVILISTIDALGYFPTFRKSFYKPHSETLITYILSGTKLLISLFALERVSFVTAFYPATLVVSNFSFVAMLIIRRRQVR